MADLILIVDDDVMVQNMLAKVLRSSGMASICASSAEEALAILDASLQRPKNPGAAGPFDLILMDINMRGMDGFSAVETIRRKGIKIPIILVFHFLIIREMLVFKHFGKNFYIHYNLLIFISISLYQYNAKNTYCQ